MTLDRQKNHANEGFRQKTGPVLSAGLKINFETIKIVLPLNYKHSLK
jgi:hypothetical protein